MIIGGLAVAAGITVGHFFYHHFVVKVLKDRVDALTAVVVELVGLNQLL